MNAMKKTTLLIYVLFFLIFAGKSQILTVRTQLDTQKILIGDPVELTYSLTCKEGVSVSYPPIDTSLPDGIELLEKQKPDTIVDDESDDVIVHLRYIITSYDSGVYKVPAQDFVFQYNNNADTIKSATESLFVTTLPVDMQKGIADIKPPYEVPFSFREALPYILYILGGAFIIFLIIYVIIRRKKNQPVFKSHKPEDPPHVVAIRRLEKLRAERLWQHNKLKQYYIDLTDIIREYIEKSTGVRALEMTTFQTTSALRANEVYNEELLEELNELLNSSDMVKFAKGHPAPEENEKYMEFAFEFIEKTKPEPVNTGMGNAGELKEETQNKF
jgi:preprotein translocase subunit SecG